MLVPSVARAQDPAGCKGNRFDMDILKDRTYIRDGETINYTVTYRNDAPDGCTVSAANILLQLPSATGDPSTAAQQLTFNETFAFGTTPVNRGPFAYKVNFGPTPPARYTARASITHGELRDIPEPYSDLTIERTLQTITVSPSLTIDKVGSTTGGPAPQSVTYTYTVKNTTRTGVRLGDGATELSNLKPADDRCSPLKFAGGDTNGDGKLQLSETWTYTCSSNFANPGTYTNTASICGDNVIDNVPMNYCSPPDTWTVTVTPPPTTTPPTSTTTTTTARGTTTPTTTVVNQGAVLPAAEVKPRCTLSTNNKVRVRAGEVSTVKVTAKNVPAKTTVTLTLPGGKRVTAKTDSKGVALLRIRPTKTGTATVRAGACSDVQRLAVLAARKTVSQRVPQVTG